MSKLVSLSDDVYYTLLKMKHQGESFSKVIYRLLQPKKKTLIEAVAMWETDPETTGKIFDEVLRHRRTAKLRDVNF